jgi:hypothetical protein
VETQELRAAFIEHSGIFKDASTGEQTKILALRECDRLLDLFNEINALNKLIEVIIV